MTTCEDTLWIRLDLTNQGQNWLRFQAWLTLLQKGTHPRDPRTRGPHPASL